MGKSSLIFTPFPFALDVFREQELLGAAAEAAEAARAGAGAPAPGSAAPRESPGHGALIPPNFPKSPSFLYLPKHQTRPQLWQPRPGVIYKLLRGIKKQKSYKSEVIINLLL